MFNRDKSRPSKEELERINTYFIQQDTPELKIHDRLERQEKIKKIQKMINKLDLSLFTRNDIGGGISRLVIDGDDDWKYTIECISVNSKDPHGIELLTLNQLEYVEKAIREWKK